MKHEFRQRQNMIEMITINLMNELNLNAFCQEKNTTGITCMYDFGKRPNTEFKNWGELKKV